MAKVPHGKVVLYTYVKKTEKKHLEIQAIRNDLTASEYTQILIRRDMDEPMKLTKEEREKFKLENPESA